MGDYMYSYYRGPINYYNSVNVPMRRSYINPLNGRKSMSLKELISKAERSVDTVNSIIPLYKKVKPVIDQGKTMLTSLTTFFKKAPVKEETKKVEKVEAEVVETPKKATETDKVFSYRVNETNSKPFFI